MIFQAKRGQSGGVLAVLLSFTLSVSCRDAQRSDPEAGLGAGGSASAVGVAGSSAAAGSGFWSCGTAAGVCSCVPIEVDLGPAVHTCGASDCCFRDPAGRCTCRDMAAGLDCTALMTTLGAARRTQACPP